jgi:hypothetical protein
MSSQSARKAQGTKLGRPKGIPSFATEADRAKAKAVVQAKANAHAMRLSGLFDKLAAEGIVSANAMAKALNDRQVKTARGGRWTAKTVLNLKARLAS